MISLSQAQPVLQELQRLGHSVDRLFADLDLPSPDTSLPLQSIQLPIMHFTSLYGHAYRLLEAETSIRADHAPIPKEVADMMCYCIINAKDLSQVIARTKSFVEMVKAQGMSMDVATNNDQIEITLDLRRSRQDTAASLVTLTAINMLHQLYSWLIGERIQLQRVTLSSPMPNVTESVKSALAVAPQFNQENNTMVFDKQLMHKPVLRTYVELMEIIDFLPFDIWYCINATNSITARVRALLLTAIEREQVLPSILTIAQIHHVSEATLRRKLASENTTFSKIREECQRECAKRLLSTNQCKIESLATRLGFHDDRSFRRAFRRWYDCSPSQFRDGNTY